MNPIPTSALGFFGVVPVSTAFMFPYGIQPRWATKVLYSHIYATHHVYLLNEIFNVYNMYVPYMQYDAYDVVNLMEELPKLSNVTHLRVTTESWGHAFGASIAELLSRCCQLQRLYISPRSILVSLAG
jgi:hypothetical protein